MATAHYDVYVSSGTLTAEIEEYCAENDLSESEFFREAARRQLQEDA